MAAANVGGPLLCDARPEEVRRASCGTGRSTPGSDHGEVPERWVAEINGVGQSSREYVMEYETMTVFMGLTDYIKHLTEKQPIQPGTPRTGARGRRPSASPGKWSLRRSGRGSSAWPITEDGAVAWTRRWRGSRTGRQAQPPAPATPRGLPSRAAADARLHRRRRRREERVVGRRGHDGDGGARRADRPGRVLVATTG